ncbi:MAG: 1-phosphofructokinase family hexose kinase [Bacteroidota bacterium]|nr:1-phosphofructokinase family hexose kinase [Bacteroidota bacterium]
MKNIVTITLNPAIDKSASIDHIVPEHKLRCADIKYEPGGGGINVSRAIKKLGGDSLAVFSSGGYSGLLMQDLLKKEDINFLPIKVRDWTRENFIVVETSTNRQYRFGMPGPEMDLQEAEQFIAALEKIDPKPEFIVASGSLPPGLPKDFYARMARTAKTLGAKFILDTSGEALQLAVDEGVYLVKPNLGELSKLAKVDSISAEKVEMFAKQLIYKNNSKVVVVSMGAAGAMLISDERTEHIPAPPVHKKSTVGAGDSMVAGMVYSLSQGNGHSEMVKFGVACGTAATMNVGTELFFKKDVENLYRWIISQ